MLHPYVEAQVHHLSQQGLSSYHSPCKSVRVEFILETFSPTVEGNSHINETTMTFVSQISPYNYAIPSNIKTI